MNPVKNKTVIIAAIFVILSLTVGCGKLTKDNYDQLKVGMAYDEVVDILGKADECSGAIGLMNCRWGDDQKNIKIKFVGKKVVVFSGNGL